MTKKEIRVRVNQELSRENPSYRSLQEMLEHVLIISSLTKMRSGVFGIKFIELVPYLQAEAKRATASK